MIGSTSTVGFRGGDAIVNGVIGWLPSGGAVITPIDLYWAGVWVAISIYQALVADTTVTDRIGNYHGFPAVFTIDPVPEDAELPYIVTPGQISDFAFDTKDILGRELERDVRIYFEETGTSKTIDETAERVRELLHRTDIGIANFDTIVADVTGPIVLDEPGVYGRVLSVRWILQPTTP